MKSHTASLMIAATAVVSLSVTVGHSAAESVVPLYSVHELVFTGPVFGPADCPARDVELVTQWRHESGRPVYTIQGFWDSDGQGGTSGSVFKVRFCPTQEGKWALVDVASNKAELRGRHQGYIVTCIASAQPGFWIVDREQAGGRWYKRSNGSHPYIYGNTMYSFLSEYDDKGPSGSNIADDIRANAAYFKKVRFSITGDRYPHPQAKPFLDDSGRPTDNGNFSHRPNPAWFHQRVDLAVQTAAEHDLIADLILCGPDTQDSRSVLQASGNGGDPTPLLRYIAARYGSYPNVWICLCNEFDIKQPRYTSEQIARLGGILRQFLPYPTPISVHAGARDWHVELNTTPAWNDHVILQRKIKKLPEAADWIARNHVLGGHIPVIDDELAYEGMGDGWSEADVIEAHLGAFLGGGYGTTGCKPANKKGHYFWGSFKASEHLAADNLGWLRKVIDENITFWRMTPVEDPNTGNGGLGIFRRVPPGSRAMAWPGQEYVLGTNRADRSAQVDLPAGRWHVARYDALRMQKTILSEDVSGRFSFEAPESRAVLFHFKRRNPNILLILADDVGWSDLGCYGGEIRTPNLDSLARGGLRFTQFYNSARCSPTRAAILTGLHPHQAGFPNLSGVLSDHCVTIPEVLKPAGSRCYMVGKWHLSRQSTPTARGFDEFYGMLGGYNTCWKEDPFYTRLPGGHPKRAYAPGAFYSTDVFGDYALDFLEDGRKSGAPWFLYLAFNAAHFPLHAGEDDIARYEKLYAQGWDKIREERLARQKELGLVPRDLKLTPRSNIPANPFNVKTGWADKDNPAWDSLPADRRADLARRMAVYAAMVDRMDQAIGRVMARLKETGQFDNTIIFFLSDNGACAEWDPYGFDETSGPKNILHTGEDLKKVGGPDSYSSYGSAWANACNTPFRLYKHYGHEGGINTPLIIHWPAGLKTKAGSITREAGHITDFMPTVLELAGASYPQERDGRPVLPLEGVSLVPVLQGGRLPPRQIFMEHEGNRAVREGRWKLVALKDKPWELYDLEADPTEMNDLAAGQTDLVARLAQAWDSWADRCSVRSPASSAPQIANKPLTITCDVEPQSREGVLLAQGGNRQGYALWLREGQLVFGVRINGRLTSITARETPVGRFTITAKLNRGGAMQLLVNRRAVAEGRAPGLIPAQPVDELSLGRDARTAVGDYTAPYPLRGKIENVRVQTDESGNLGAKTK